jgi:hypothetical protein
MHHPIKWLIDNPAALSAFGVLTSSLLTFVLIVLTALYSRANWKTMRLMETDLRFRTKPIPVFDVTMGVDKDGWMHFAVKVSTTNAPLRFVSLLIKFPQEDGNHTHQVHAQVQNRVLRIGPEYQLVGEFFPSSPTSDWKAKLVYSDLAGLHSYVTSFEKSEPFLDYERMIEDALRIPNLWVRIKGHFREPR